MRKCSTDIQFTNIDKKGDTEKVYLWPLNAFFEFNPQTDPGSKIPEAPGNYIVTIRDIKALPTLGHKIVTQQFRSQLTFLRGQRPWQK